MSVRPSGAMALVSVQVSTSGGRVLRDWGVIGGFSEKATVLELYDGIINHAFDESDPFVLPENLRGGQMSCFVGSGKNDKFQRVFPNAEVVSLVTFGRYIRFHVVEIEKNTAASTSQNETKNAFQLMMEQSYVLPEKFCLDNRSNGKLKLFNSFVDLLRQHELGFHPHVAETTGKQFVSAVADVIWYIDPHIQKLKLRGIEIPVFFHTCIGLNNPESYKQKAKNLEKKQKVSM